MTGIVHVGLSRGECEDRLQKNGKDGCFLVRESETYRGTYSMSILYNGNVKHYRIKQRIGKFYIDAEEGVEKTYKPTISELIEEYQKRGPKNGLVCALKYAIMPDSTVDSDAEIPDEEMEDEEYDYVRPAEGSSSDNSLQYIADELERRMQNLDLSIFEGDFITLLQDYASKQSLVDATIVNGGTEHPVKLHEVLVNAAKDLNKELDVFKRKVNCIQQLFGYNPTTIEPSLPSRKGSKDAFSIELDQLQAKLRTAVVHLQKTEGNAVSSLQQLLNAALPPQTATKTFTDTVDMSTVRPFVPPRGRMKPQQFSALMYKSYCKNSAQVHITVDVHAGKVSAVRPSHANLDSSNVFICSKIVQLVKSTKNNTVVDMYLEGKSKPESYQFEDMLHREQFCQLVSHMKMVHTDLSVLDQISVFVGTWNMADESPTWKLDDWFKCQGQGTSMPELLSDVPFDMYVIGTQETNISEKDWIKRIQEFFSNKYPDTKWHLVASEALWQIRICIFVKFDYRNMITNIQTSRQATGIANTLFNKGAVGASFNFQGTSFCFICSHLTSGSEKNARRNNNYRDILKGLKLGPRNLGSECDLTNKFHHMFFFGDLNYRVEGLEPEDIIKKVEKKEYLVIQNHDQLKGSKQSGEVFVDFQEAGIFFAPTYRLEKNSVENKYIWQKVKRTGVRINAPSYTDRVLWKSYPGTHIENIAYGSVPAVNVSDHKPVFSAFRIGLISQFLSPRARAGTPGNTKVIFKELSAHIKMSTKVRMTVEMISGCMEMPKTLPTNIEFTDYKEGYCSPSWKGKCPIKLDTVLEDLDFLEDQHIVLIVKSGDLMDHYGSTVVSLRHALNGPAPFETPLVYDGRQVGHVKGVVQIENQSSQAALPSPRRRKSYNFIYLDTDDRGVYRPAAPLPEESEDRQSAGYDVDEMHDTDEYAEVISTPARNKVVTEGSKGHSPTPQEYAEIVQKPSFRRLVDEGVRSPVTKAPSPRQGLPPPRKISNAKMEAEIYSESADDSSEMYGAVYEAHSLEPPAARPHPKKSPSGSPRVMPKNLANRDVDGDCMYSDLANTQQNYKPAPNTFATSDGARLANQPQMIITQPTDDVEVSWKSQAPQADENAAQYYNSEPNARKSTDDPEETDYYNFEIARPEMEDNPLYDHDPAPQPPPRTYHSHGDQYVRVYYPASVKEWLASLGLSRYEANFYNNGWDSMFHMGDLTVQDLQTIGVTERAEQERLLQSLVSLKKKNSVT